MAAQFGDRVSFAVPVTTATYAPERLQLNRGARAIAASSLSAVTALIESNAATGATLELWLAKPGADPTLDASFFFSGKTISSGSDTWILASWPGAQLRAKSAGVAGAMVVIAQAD